MRSKSRSVGGRYCGISSPSWSLIWWPRSSRKDRSNCGCTSDIPSDGGVASICWPLSLLLSPLPSARSGISSSVGSKDAGAGLSEWISLSYRLSFEPEQTDGWIAESSERSCCGIWIPALRNLWSPLCFTELKVHGFPKRLHRVHPLSLALHLTYKCSWSV